MEFLVAAVMATLLIFYGLTFYVFTYYFFLRFVRDLKKLYQYNGRLISYFPLIPRVCFRYIGNFLNGEELNELNPVH